MSINNNRKVIKILPEEAYLKQESPLNNKEKEMVESYREQIRKILT
ncbi:MAG: hypothetical protein LBU14_03960 [Candidatus Peribacteria bacterium]|jgi:hypothetical protein|nr:hypothetical protein [Candidatus Peribacteria bacterium]